MDYRQAYVRLIERAKERTEDNLDLNQKYEWHHYFPICFWSDRKENKKIVPLTLREHWIAHRLLFKMFPCQGTVAALLCMSKRDPRMNSRKFERLRRVLSEHNWTKTPEGRAFLSQQMKRRIAEGWAISQEGRQKISEATKETQQRWREEGGHPLSSDEARAASSERAKARNKEMNAWLNKEKGKVVRTCNRCGAQIKGTMGNMKQHQRGRKCIPKADH
jgi:hypothetical protein